MNAGPSNSGKKFKVKAQSRRKNEIRQMTKPNQESSTRQTSYKRGRE
jgi:hypothetical protein